MASRGRRHPPSQKSSKNARRPPFNGSIKPTEAFKILTLHDEDTFDIVEGRDNPSADRQGHVAEGARARWHTSHGSQRFRQRRDRADCTRRSLLKVLERPFEQLRVRSLIRMGGALELITVDAGGSCGVRKAWCGNTLYEDAFE